MKHGLVFAMEEDQTVDAPPAELVPETAAEVEAGSAELTEQVGEVEEVTTAIEEAEADAESLGEIQEVMAESVEQGEGLPEEAAEVAEIAVESICRRLGIRNADKIMPATESFGSTNSRLAATKIAMEGISDTIRRIWEAIKAAIARAWEMIKSFFIGLAKSAPALVKHLEALKERVKNLPEGAKPEKKELEGGVAKLFSVNKKADVKTAEQIVANSAKLLEASSKVTSAVGNIATDITGLVKASDVPAGMNEYLKKKNGFSETISSTLAMLGTVATEQGSAKEGKDGKTTFYGPFVGTRALAFKVETKEIGGESYTAWKLGMETIDKIAATKAAALDKDQCYTLLGAGIKLMDDLITYEKHQKAIESISAACRKASEDVLGSLNKMAKDNSDSSSSRVLRQIATEVNGLNDAAAKLGTTIPSAVFACGKAVGDYVSASVANMKSK